ncbi:MBL fold metallo-hydrolase [Prauserella muralis]|uniref:MBL fold metallo-hydrolase n=1 Tax=Prauserella muralis TaxID=588067 RepID=A0A2V4B6U4_9PSEU|nr:MBL fold metallo-hydrolase [Prauserella muralis]PXY30937.1 MBL fold metallo-hydrolase [Prauserella muralis]TWE14811.1 metallo-beta-lactamase superfamily protein [Prauserella muralis]
MRVHHLNCGTLRPPGGALIDGAGSVARRAHMICHCLLLETDTGLVLVETGMGTPAVTRPREWLGAPFVRLTNPVAAESETAIAQVRLLGFDPADVRHIVLTHLDLDHAGGLVDFPDATVHLYARELRALEQPADARERSRYRRIQFAHGPKFSSYSDHGEPWFGFDAVRSLTGLPPEILLVPLAGHTRGHAGVAIDTGDGWLLAAGDAYFFHGQLDAARPHCPPGLAVFERVVQTDRQARLRNQERLRELAAGHGDEVSVFCAHDPVELRRSLG